MAQCKIVHKFASSNCHKHQRMTLDVLQFNLTQMHQHTIMHLSLKTISSHSVLSDSTAAIKSEIPNITINRFINGTIFKIKITVDGYFCG